LSIGRRRLFIVTLALILYSFLCLLFGLAVVLAIDDPPPL
jgi:hypothetical protein